MPHRRRSAIHRSLRRAPYAVGVAVLIGWTSPPAVAGNATLPASGRIELVTWVPGKEEYKFTQLCTLSGKNIHCFGALRVASGETTVMLDGTVENGLMNVEYNSTTHYEDPACVAVYSVKSSLNLALDDSGNGRGTWNGGTGLWTKASAKCSMLVGKTEQHGPEQSVATWRIFDVAQEQARFGDAQVSSALWKQLGQPDGALARKCFNEVFAKLNEPANAVAKDRIATAAYQVHIVDLMAAAAEADDFDPQWLEAAKGIGGAGGAQQTFTDRLVKLLPPPVSTLVGLSQKAYRLANGVNEMAVLPLLKGKLYDAYKMERSARPNDPPAEVLKDASTSVGGWTMLKTNLLPHFPRANDAARETAMANYLAARFDFVYRARDIASNKEKHVALAWAAASSDVARIRSAVRECIIK